MQTESVVMIAKQLIILHSRVAILISFTFLRIANQLYMIAVFLYSIRHTQQQIVS